MLYPPGGAGRSPWRPACPRRVRRLAAGRRSAQLLQDIEENLRSLGVERLAAVDLRLNEGARPDQRFDDQLAVMVKAREDCLIGGIGLSGVTREHLLYAVGQTDIVCA